MSHPPVSCFTGQKTTVWNIIPQPGILPPMRQFETINFTELDNKAIFLGAGLLSVLSYKKNDSETTCHRKSQFSIILTEQSQINQMTKVFEEIHKWKNNLYIT